MKRRPAEQQQTSALFSLPPEIRNDIYELLLRVDRSDGTVQIVKFSKEPHHAPSHRRPQSVLSLLLVCRQIHDEARGIFYNVNHLRFTENPRGSGCLQGFLSALSKERLLAIRAMTIILPETLEAIGLLWLIKKLCTRLRVLHVIPAWVSASLKLEKHLNTLILEFERLEEFKVISAPWGSTIEHRAFNRRKVCLSSIEGRVQQNFKAKRLALEASEGNNTEGIGLHSRTNAMH